MKTAKKKAKAMPVRGPFAHAADYRDALAAFDAVLLNLAENATRWDHHKSTRRAMGVSGSAAHMFLRAANQMIADGTRLRAASRRLLVAEYGAKHARVWDGWKLPARTAG